jgi:hypothetical protein
MSLFMNLGNQVTVAAGATVFSNWTYPGAVDTGPNYISAYFIGAEDNYGTVTTLQTSVNSFYTNAYGYYWPMGISYSGQMRNDSSWSVMMTVNIGNFQ